VHAEEVLRRRIQRQRARGAAVVLEHARAGAQLAQLGPHARRFSPKARCCRCIGGCGRRFSSQRAAHEAARNRQRQPRAARQRRQRSKRRQQAVPFHMV
jgi:hypothetical protein